MRAARRVGLWLGAGALLSLVVIVCLYYIPHKPLSPATALAVVRALLDVTLAAALMAAASGLGAALLPKPHPNREAALVVQASLGLGAASILVLVAGAIGVLQRWALWGMLLVLGAVLRRRIAGWLRGWREVVRVGLPESGFVRVMCALGGLVVVASLVEALAPPVHFDALVYHLALPQEFLLAQRLIFTPDNPFWGMPLGVEMLYTWAMALGRAQTAAVLGWIVGVLALAGVMALGRSLGRNVGWVAAAALLSGETLAASMGWAYADWLVTLHAAAALLALDAWRRDGRLCMAAWAGAAAGLAFGAKYSGAVVIVGGVAAVLASGNKSRRARALAAFVAAAGVAALPWLVKNALWTGDPFFPFLGQSPWVDSTRQAFYRGLPFRSPGVKVILTPILATLQGVEGAPGFAASLGPLLLGLVPGVALARRRTVKEALPVSAYLFAGWVMWAVGQLYSPQLAQSRLYYGVYPAWALLAGVGYAGMARVRLGRVRVRRVVQAVVVLVLGFAAAFALVAAGQMNMAAAAFGLEPEAEYRQRRLGATALAMEQVRALEGASVLFLWEPRGMDCAPVCRADAWIDRWYVDRRAYRSGERILEAWRASGVTHVLLYRAGMEYVRGTEARYTKEDWTELEALLASLTEQTTVGEAYALYRLP